LAEAPCLILFTPYDYGHWGFDCMGRGNYSQYIRYAVARLSSYRNVWWALANEWPDNLCKCNAGEYRKNCSQAAWDVMGAASMQQIDTGGQKPIHNHSKSIHNHSKWIHGHSKSIHNHSKRTTAIRSALQPFEAHYSHSNGHVR
jgi:hypothetical protein